jgi:hypothetical protein
MGLDIVVLFIDIEEAVGVRIPDDVAQSLTTPRQVIDYLYSKLPHSTWNPCLSQRASYRLRKTLAARCVVPTKTLRPATELLGVLPSDNPQEAWAEVGHALKISRWQPLRGRGWFARIFQSSWPPTATVGQVAVHIADHVPRTIKGSAEGWSWQEVAAVARRLMQYHLGLRDFHWMIALSRISG